MASRPTFRRSLTVLGSGTRFRRLLIAQDPWRPDRGLPRPRGQPRRPFPVKDGGWRDSNCPRLDNHAHGHGVRGADSPVQRRKQRRGRRTLHPARRGQADGQAVFLPIADQIESGTYLLYDGRCGTGGMLTVAEETLRGTGRRTRQGSLDSPVRPRDQPRDLRHLQGRPAA